MRWTLFHLEIERVKLHQVLVQSTKRTPTKDIEGDNQRLKRKRLQQEALLASSVAARELRAVVALASRRGLNAEEVFQHFVFDDGTGTDAGGRGAGRRRAGPKEIVRGMKGLGISLSEEAATLLIEMIVCSRVKPPRRLPTLPTASVSRLRGKHGQLRGAQKEGEDAATMGGVHNMLSRTERGPSSKSSTAGLKPSSSPCQHINAGDLWNFARIQRSELVRSLNKQEEKCSTLGGDERLTSESQEQFEEQAKTGPVRSIHGESGPSSKRRRTKDSGYSRRGGGAKSTTGNDAFKEEPHDMGRTNRLSPQGAHVVPNAASSSSEPTSGPLTSWGNTKHAFGNYQSSVSAVSSIFAGSDAGDGADAGTASVRRTGHEEAVGQDARRPHMVLDYANSVNSRGLRDLRESDGRLLCPPRKPSPVFPEPEVPEQEQGGVPAAAPCTSFEKAEVLSFPCENPTAEAMDGKDRVFHVDR